MGSEAASPANSTTAIRIGKPTASHTIPLAKSIVQPTPYGLGIQTVESTSAVSPRIHPASLDEVPLIGVEDLCARQADQPLVAKHDACSLIEERKHGELVRLEMQDIPQRRPPIAQ